jgi:hypothetical protein
VPPSGATSPPSSAATEQSVVDQFSCQGQAGGGAAQTQTASQTSTTVQIAQAAASLPGVPQSLTVVAPVPQVVDQTEQQIWQLQVGCLFYCVESQQLQEAQQSTTTIQIVAAASGSSAGSRAVAIAVVQQTIWQVQIGCLAWCWDSTQAQAASTQGTIPVATGPPAGEGPAPGPGPAPGQAPGPGPAPAAVALPTSGSSEPVSGAAGPRPAAGGESAIRLFGSPRRTGLAILEQWSTASAAAPPSRLAPHRARFTVATVPARPAALVRSVSASSARRRPARRPASPASSAPRSPAAVAAQPLIRESGEGRLPAIVLLLAVAGIVSLAVILRRRHR